MLTIIGDNGADFFNDLYMVGNDASIFFIKYSQEQIHVFEKEDISVFIEGIPQDIEFELIHIEEKKITFALINK